MKALSLIHLTKGVELMDTLDRPETQLQLVAVYNATAAQLVKAAKDPAVMEDLVAQAAEESAESALEKLRDFFGQMARYNSGLGSSGQLLTAAAQAMTGETPAVS